MENNQPPQFEEPDIILVPANHLKRLANYIIDVTIFSIIFSFFIAFVNPGNAFMHKVLMQQPFTFMDEFPIIFSYGLYMSVMEALLKGKTIGKYITGTRAVTEDGHAIKSQTAFSRGIIRIIPFEQLSAISMPCRLWHDRWSNSFVVDEAKSVLPKI